MLKAKKSQGFTLIEILFVIIIIGIVAAVIIIGISQSAKEKSRVASVIQFADSVRANLSSHEVAWWKFEETGTNSVAGSVKDIWGGNNGTPSNMVFQEAGVGKGKAFRFNESSNSYVLTLVADKVNYFRAGVCNNSIPWTTSVWFKTSTTTYANDKGMIMGSGGGSGTAVNYTVYVEAGALNVRFLNATTTVAPTVSDDKWHLLVVTWNATSAKAYFDSGDAIDLNVPTSGSCGQIHTLVIGATNSDSPNLFFDGTIDEVQIWNSAITAEQARRLYVESAPRYGIALK